MRLWIVLAFLALGVATSDAATGKLNLFSCIFHFRVTDCRTSVRQRLQNVRRNQIHQTLFKVMGTIVS